MDGQGLFHYGGGMAVCSCTRETGASATEFAVAALPFILAGLTAFEASRWMMARQAIGYALMEAARAGSVAHAHPEVMETALERNLLPLWGSDGTPEGERKARQRLHEARTHLHQRYSLPLWHLMQLSPGAAHFEDFGLTLARPAVRYIRHSYQAEQHARFQQLGYAGGQGPASGATIFAANTLTLRIVYLHRPLVPGLATVVSRLATVAAPSASASGAAAAWPASRAAVSYHSEGTSNLALAGLARAGYIPIRYQVSIEMQSAPIDWSSASPAALAAALSEAPELSRQLAIQVPASAHGAALDPPPINPSPRGTPVSGFPCLGASCAPLSPGPGGEPPPAPPRRDTHQPSHTIGITPETDDVACGVVLCCAS